MVTVFSSIKVSVKATENQRKNENRPIANSKNLFLFEGISYVCTPEVIINCLSKSNNLILMTIKGGGRGGPEFLELHYAI